MSLSFYLVRQLLLCCTILLLVWHSPKAQVIPKPQAIVVARLVEIPGKLPANDLYNYVYVFKYRVIKVVSGTVSEKEILVGQYNPRIPRNAIKDRMKNMVSGNLQQFRPGEVHRLSLVRPLGEYYTDAVEDEYFDDESVRWYALHTDLEP